ncbi:MAG: hypothetical protein HRT61_07640 [Ekhidna sp.]|nr:hypothetical protein [Ekhidna sp.]
MLRNRYFVEKEIVMGAAQRLEAIQEFLSTKADDRFINLVFSMVETEKEYQPISVEQYNKELDEADAEMDRGEFISHEELKEQMKNW